MHIFIILLVTLFTTNAFGADGIFTNLRVGGTSTVNYLRANDIVSTNGTFTNLTVVNFTTSNATVSDGTGSFTYLHTKRLSTAFFVSGYSSINAAHAAASAVSNSVLILDWDKSLTSNITITIPIIWSGGLISCGTYTVTISGSLNAGRDRVFDSTCGVNDVSFNYGSVDEIYPEWWGAVGDGSDSYTALQSAINALPLGTYLGGKVKFSDVFYTYGTTLVLRNNGIYEGTGNNVSYLKYTGNSDAVQVNNPINSVTTAYITIKDLAIWSTTVTAGKAGLADIGSTYLSLERVTIFGNQYDLILDQSELVRVSECIFSPQSATGAGIWIVNGADHTAGAATNYSNQIIIEKNQFNGVAGSTLIADDGGVDHVIQNNNFNAGGTQIRLAGGQNTVVAGNEFEGASVKPIHLVTTTFGLGTATAANRSTTIRDNFFTSGGTECIDFDANSAVHVTVTNNEFNLIVGGAIPFTGTSNVNSIIAYGNIAEKNGTVSVIDYSTYGGLGFGSSSYVPFNNVNVASSLSLLPTYTPTWTGTGSPEIGNGTLVGSWIRNGNMVTANMSLTSGATTTFGTAGGWSFSLPAADNSGLPTIGHCLVSSSTGTKYSGMVYLAGNASTVQIYTSDTPTALGPTSPFTFSGADNVVYFTITYSAASNTN